MTAEHAPRILYQVKQGELAVRGRLDAVVRPHGITVTQYTALTVLEQHPGMSSAVACEIRRSGANRTYRAESSCSRQIS